MTLPLLERVLYKVPDKEAFPRPRQTGKEVMLARLAGERQERIVFGQVALTPDRRSRPSSTRTPSIAGAINQGRLKTR